MPGQGLLGVKFSANTAFAPITKGVKVLATP